MLNHFLFFSFTLLFHSQSPLSFEGEKERDEIPREYKWDLSILFKSPDEWEKKKDLCEKKLNEISTCKEILTLNSKNLLKCLDLIFNLKKDLERLFTFASMVFSTQRDIPENKSRLERVKLLSTKFQKEISFLEPELLKIEENKIWGFLKEEKDLKNYDHYFDDLIRRKSFVLSQKEEEIIALSSDLRASPYAMLNALEQDIKFPLIKDEMGKDVQLTQANFPKYRASIKREVRKECVEKFFLTLKNYENSFSTSLDMGVKSNIFIAKSRGFKNALEASLFQNAIPVELYETLLGTTQKNLKSTLHRYISLRKKVLGLDKIYYYDLYNPLIPEYDKKIVYEDAAKAVIESFSLLGQEYKEIGKSGMLIGNGWVDIYPNKGKRSGAYCTASYGEHPFIFLNYVDKLEDVFTLTHEMGHAIHYYYSMKNQPYQKYEAQIFLAEIASTFNEEILLSHLLGKAKTKEEKLYLLNKRIENIRTTVFRQVMFSEFEHLIHKEVEEGGALTAKRIGEIYRGLIEKYYGNEFTIGESDYIEWAYVPHFYYNFYVYQYATGLMSAIAFSQKILKGEKGSINKYFEFLKSGGSDYPLNILKKAGIDFSSPSVMEETFKLFKTTLDEFEREFNAH